jgi:hypothetical protein
MTAQYLVLAIKLAVTLNHANRFVRAAGTALAAISLAFIVLSIALADIDGTFAVLPADNFRPALLNLLAALAIAAILFLLWAMLRQLQRRSTAASSWGNTDKSYGLVSRYLHWVTAVLMLSLVPIGLVRRQQAAFAIGIAAALGTLVGPSSAHRSLRSALVAAGNRFDAGRRETWSARSLRLVRSASGHFGRRTVADAP